MFQKTKNIDFLAALHCGEGKGIEAQKFDFHLRCIPPRFKRFGRLVNYFERLAACLLTAESMARWL